MEAYGKLALSFGRKRGTDSRRSPYVSHGSGYELFLTPEEAVVALQPSSRGICPRCMESHIFDLCASPPGRENDRPPDGTRGANLEAKISGIDSLPGKVNYFLGNKPEHWRYNGPTYSRVKYAASLSGVDLVFYGNQRSWSMNFVVAREPIRRPSRSR